MAKHRRTEQASKRDRDERRKTEILSAILLAQLSDGLDVR